MKLVQDWRQCYKWISVWCLGFTGAISATWDTLPTTWQQILLNNSSVGVCFKAISIISLMGIVGRLIDQNKESKQ